MTVGTGYFRGDGRFADVEQVEVLAYQLLESGQTIGPAVPVGDRVCARATLEVFAEDGSSPTLDVTLQTSFDGVNGWRSVGAFDRKTDVGLAMGAVTETGTTPPDITLTGTPLVPIDMRIECTTLGARGVAVIRYSIDGGVTWTSGVTTAATIPLGDTGVTINYENATAAVDNVWTAKTAGFERKAFAGLSRFIRAVAQVGGSGGPEFTASVRAELV